MNSDNELDSGSEDENENREMMNGNKKLDAEFTPVATEENEVEYLVEGTLANRASTGGRISAKTPNF